MANFDEVLFETANRLIKSVDQLPKYDDTKKQRIKELIDDGAHKIQNKLYDEAIKSFEEAISINPRSFGAHLALIQGFREKGKDLEALSWGGFALALADSPLKRKMVYLLLGSTALDTFRLSHTLEHAHQSLGFYQLALKEDSTELRAVWNAVETHVAVVCTDELGEVTGKKHRVSIANKLKYLDSTFAKSPNVALASRFILEGEKLQKQLRERNVSIPEFSQGLSSLRVHVDARDNIASLGEGVLDSPEEQRSSMKKKVLAYVLASFFLTAGILYSAIGEAKGLEISQAVPVSQQTYTTAEGAVPYLEQVLELTEDNNIQVVTVDPDWEEFKRLATVDPDWSEFKNLV